MSEFDLSVFPWEDRTLLIAEAEAVIAEQSARPWLGEETADDFMIIDLENIFAVANRRKATRLALRVDVIFGQPIIHLAGYRIGSDTWTRFERPNERIPFTHEMANALMDRYGWCMPARPVKQPGLAFIWNLEAIAPDAFSYSTRAQGGEAVERRTLNERLEELDAIRDLIF